MFTVVSCKSRLAENHEELARRTSRPEVVMVKTVRLGPSTFFHEIVSNGKVYSSSKAIVPFKVNGIIEELYIRNGQKVRAGELLAVIEDFEYKINLTSARQDLTKAEINFRDDLLSKYLTADTANLEPAKIRTSRIRSGLDDALIALERAEYNYNNTRIYSPLEGVIANLEATRLNPSQNYTSLCTVISNSIMLVEFPVMESEYGFISSGMPVGIIPFVDDSLVITGRIIQINPQVEDNGMIRVRAEFANNGRLIDGMNVRVLVRKPAYDRLVIPKEALVIRQGKDVVFVRQDSLAIWKYVTIEYENSSMVSVSEGLSPGDLVIVSGNTNLAHETKVKEE
jgi:RND family efflux transporter MFP subunit